MGITVQNITGNTAMVIWPKMASCADSFYSIMYHPNWNSMLSSYSRKSFQKEERVPASRSSFVVENLTPLTTYILCVTCQSANPSSDQCRVFNTLEQDPASASNTKKELALGIWLTSSVLLLIIAAILLYGCLHVLCHCRKARTKSAAYASEELVEVFGWQPRLLYYRQLEHTPQVFCQCEFYPHHPNCFSNYTLQTTTHRLRTSLTMVLSEAPIQIRSISACKLNYQDFNGILLSVFEISPWSKSICKIATL
uniref:Fibronectin type-III domain-containing protein n=1 Tax=Strix occidentalis caurina TaxID=311401 RepID=A0A8D0EY20_STROC